MSIEEESQVPEDATMKSIRQNVEYVRTQFSEQVGVTLDLNSESIERIDGYINRYGVKLYALKKGDGIVDLFGSFLGETIIKVYGGEWRLNKDKLGIRFDNNSWAFPFAKTYKHFENGPEDSMYSFFKIVPRFLDNSLTKNGKPK